MCSDIFFPNFKTLVKTSSFKLIICKVKEVSGVFWSLPEMAENIFDDFLPFDVNQWHDKLTYDVFGWRHTIITAAAAWLEKSF